MRSVAAAILALAVTVPALAAPASRGVTRARAQRAAQAPAPGPQLPPGGEPITPRRIQQLFDAFIVLQAKDRLSLSEPQYFKFMARLQTLQETRRIHQQAHQRILNDLRKLTNPQTGSNDEAAITERLKALRDEDAAAAVDVQKAYDGVDDTLDMRQQARFRIFEDQVEQQKLELLMRARAQARAKRGGH
jgi:hypothetical protein